MFSVPAVGASQHPVVRSHGVVFSTGNKYQAEIDLSLDGPLGTLVIRRYYNSQSNDNGPFGYGWSGGIAELSRLEINGDIIVRTFAKGRKKLFSGNTAEGWTSLAGETETITATTTGYQIIESGDTVCVYDGDGQLLSHTDRNGNQFSFSWSGELLQSLSDPVGRTLVFSYDSGKITAISSPAGDFTYTYDSNDNLTGVTKPDGTTRSYRYEDPNDPHNLTAMLDEEDRTRQSIGYDVHDRVVSSSLGGSETLTFDYSGGLERRITDSRGVDTTYQIGVSSGIARVTAITGPGCTSCGGAGADSSYTYDERQQLLSRTDGRGHITRYTYDERGNRTTHVEAAGTTEERTTTFTYKPGSSRIATVSRGSAANPGAVAITAFTYDTVGNIETMTESGFSGTTPINRTTTYDFDGQGRLILVDGPRTDVGDTVVFSYYPSTPDQGNNRANLQSITNALGHVITYADYNVFGKPETIIGPNTTTTLTYDQAGRIASRSEGGLTTTYSHDAAGRLDNVQLPGGRTIAYGYTTAGDLETVTDTLGNSITYRYDSAGNRTGEEIRDPSGLLRRSVAYAHDEAGRLARITQPDGNFEEFEYDATGNLISHLNALTQTTTYDYDALNRLRSIIAPDTAQTGFSFDLKDHLTGLNNAEGQLTTYQYDDFGRRTGDTSPDTGQTSYTYDAQGNLLSRTDAGGTTVSFAYDESNRTTAVDLPGAVGAYRFTYDQGAHAVGRLSSITDPHGSSSYAYDGLGRITSETRVIGTLPLTIGYTYDPVSGELLSLTYPSGLLVGYQRDGAGRITGITANGSPLLHDASYLPFGPTESYHFGTDQHLTSSFNERSLLTELHGGGLHYRYSYDPAGRVSAIEGVMPPDPQAETTAFIYETGTSRLDSQSGNNARDYSFDPAGNLISDGSRTYRYDALNRLIQVDQDGLTIATYAYDASHRRISKTLGTAQTVFAYDLQGHLISELSADGTPLRDYVWFEEQPLALIDYTTPSPRTCFFINDHLGTPQRLVDETGLVVWQAAYTPYGNAQVQVGTVENNLRFPGQYYDAETGLHYNWHRYYDPATGRYISADPIGLAGGINLYVYVGGNPINWIDPEGLDITIYYYPGTIGHIGVDTPGTWYGSIGFRSENHELSGPGEVSIDDFHDYPIPETLTIETTCEEDNCMRDCIEKRRKNSGDYKVFTRNCVDFVRDCLKQCGLPSGGISFYPDHWFNTFYDTSRD